MDFLSVYDRYYSAVQRFILTLVKDEWVADDLAQETFTRAIAHKGALRDSTRLSAWVFSIAYNLCKDHFRTPRKDVFETCQDTETAVPAPAAGIQTSMEQCEMSACVQEQMQRLPEPLLTVLVLFDMFEFDQAEIAAIVDISVANVKVRLHRARSKLREILEAECAFTKDQRGVLVCTPVQEKVFLGAGGGEQKRRGGRNEDV